MPQQDREGWGANKPPLKVTETRVPGSDEVSIVAEVGPIWNQADAVAKAKKFTDANPGVEWTGHWTTTVVNKMSVIRCRRYMNSGADAATTLPPNDSAGGKPTLNSGKMDGDGARQLQGPDDARDRNRLCAFYDATGGPSWTHSDGWKSDRLMGEWYGVTTNADGRVVSLNLSHNNLKGVLPAMIGDFDALETLYMSNNHLHGGIPPALGKLNKLKRVSLDWNPLGGVIPAELGGLCALENLKLTKIDVHGKIPEEFGQLRSLRHLYMNFNFLEGCIPPQLLELPSLEILHLSGNRLEGLWDRTQDAANDQGGHYVSNGGQVPDKLRRILETLTRLDTRVVGNGAGMLKVSLALDRNPWSEPPEAIMSQGMAAAAMYFDDLYAEPFRVRRNSVKVVLVGQEGAGKTSLRQSMKTQRATPTNGSNDSTVCVDVDSMELEGASVRVYDCAGQVVYTGLLQMFLTPRAVCVVVCNAGEFERQSSGGIDQLEDDIAKLCDLRVCDWLRTISHRVPDSSAILVATKCDLVAGRAPHLGQRMETACRKWLASWVKAGMEPVLLEPGVSLTSCCTTTANTCAQKGNLGTKTLGQAWECDWRRHEDTDEEPPRSMLHRLVRESDSTCLRGAEMVLPRSWDAALTVLQALEHGSDPVEAVLQSLAQADGSSTETSQTARTKQFQGITVRELGTEWDAAVDELAKVGVEMTRADRALEGALSIREFEGTLVRHDTFVFLDVVWLTQILKPLLNHKDKTSFDGSVFLGDTGDTCITLEDEEQKESWRRLKEEGILEPELARALWPRLFEYVLPTLDSLGLTFPLENDPDEGLVVLLRLGSQRPKDVGEDINAFRNSYQAALSVRWEFFLGVPPGAMEKVLTRCCGIGGVQTFWRFGVLVQGGGETGKFALVLEYSPKSDEANSEPQDSNLGNNVLDMKVYGDITTAGPWTALAFAISTVRNMVTAFPGLKSRAYLECPEHGKDMPLSTKAASPGDQLLLQNKGCRRCSPETEGLGAAAMDLLRIVDVQANRGVVFNEMASRFLHVQQRYAGLRPMVSPDALEIATGRSSQGDTAAAVLKHIDRRMDGLEARVGQTLRIIVDGVEAVKKSTSEITLGLKSLQGPNYPYPHLAVLRKDEQSVGKANIKKSPFQSVFTRARRVAMNDMRVTFLCPADLSEVPCGHQGRGYKVRVTREWVKKISPVVQVTLTTVRVAVRAAAGVDLPVPDFVNDMQAGFLDEFADSLMDDGAVDNAITGTGTEDEGLEHVTGPSYGALKTFMDKEKRARKKTAKAGDGYVDFRERMERVSDGKGGMVWIRNENVGKWLESRKTAS